MEIPKEIIDIVELEAHNPFSFDNTDLLNKSRETALEYIRIYKENKKAYLDIRKKRKVLSDWLDKVKKEEDGEKWEISKEQG